MGKFEKNRKSREEAELEAAFNQAAGSGKSKKKSAAAKTSGRKNYSAIIAICLCVALLFLGAVGAGLFYILGDKDDGRILPNVYAAGINLGGMSPEEAGNVLHLSTDRTYTQTDMVIRLPSEVITLSPADTGASLDVQAVVDAAYRYGRTGTRAEQQQAREKAESTPTTLDIIPYLNLNTDYILALMTELDITHNSSLTQPTVTVSGDRPSLDPEELETDAPGQVLTVTLGTPEAILDTTALYGKVIDAYSSNIFEVSLDYSVVQPEVPDPEALFAEYCVEPVDAVIDTNSYEIVPEIYGYGFDVEEVRLLLQSAAPGASLEIPLDYLTPAVTKESLGGTLFQDVLGSCETWQASSNNRITNLRLACEAINGIVLKPGEIFSYNNALGERTAEKGYKDATAYVGGESVLSLGGGICQVSSALYYCTLYADLEIVERACHMYPSSYVPLGMDATVYWGLLDFKFRNNTEYPIRIVAEATGDGGANIRLMGTDDKSYYVEMSYTVLETLEWEEVIQEVPADNNPKGYKDGEVITTAHTGYEVTTYKKKYDKTTNELISTEFEDDSSYTKTDKVIIKLIYPEEPTEPEETVPEETEPQPTDPPIEGGIPGTAGEG